MDAADMISTDEASLLSGTTRVTINTWIKSGRCIGVAHLRRGFKLPCWQFEPTIWPALPLAQPPALRSANAVHTSSWTPWLRDAFVYRSIQSFCTVLDGYRPSTPLALSHRALLMARSSRSCPSRKTCCAGLVRTPLRPADWQRKFRAGPKSGKRAPVDISRHPAQIEVAERPQPNEFAPCVPRDDDMLCIAGQEGAIFDGTTTAAVVIVILFV